MKISYQDSGVNISEGNRAVELMKSKVKETYINGVIGEIGLFAGGFSLKEFMHMEEPTLLASTDGVGTKLLIAQKMDIHNTVGIDLVAMCVNDLICQGAKPLFFLDYIATGKVDAMRIADIVGGIADGCKESGCALIGGETAEMPGLYSDDEYDLGGFSVGILDKKDIIDGSDICSGDAVIGIASSGLHSNGYSLARKIFFEHLNLNTEDKLENMSDTIGNLLITPTKLYVNTILNLLDKFKIKGIANITGGGLIENVPRILPDTCKAKIYADKWTLPEIFKKIVELDLVEKDELYRSFNMGIGMIIVVSKEIADDVCAFINKETGDSSFIIGNIIAGEKSCEIIH
ncbi:phosphoribosylformylglycinamidine cyclo-ligase [Proteocatella sphenisci]|uniref:phosphoribosylformylglycinamidine cyclo-ligase n=1 Tax=Proteocatella sphenisci TaxID=181070 RepID=UPI00048D83C6|nr:phosphoribosylformylglycinamidine cyclo-ligase [Proteocatella sphenisci]